MREQLLFQANIKRRKKCRKYKVHIMHKHTGTEYFLKVPSIYFLQKNSQSVSKKIIHAGDHDIKRNIFEDETAVLNLC